MKTYYYTDGKTNYGPFTVEELKEKNLTPETFVWTHSFSEWKRLKDVPELRDLPVTIPQPLLNEQKSSGGLIDILLVGALIFWLFDRLMHQFMPFILSNMNVDFNKVYPYINLVSTVICMFIPVIVAYAIKNQTLRIVGIVISIILAIVMLAGSIYYIIQVRSFMY